MSDTQLEPEVAPAPVRKPRRLPVIPAAEPVEPQADPAVGVDAVVPETSVQTVPMTETTEASAEPALTPERRKRRAANTAAVTVPWESDLPGVRSSEIRAELAKRERRAAALLAERERILHELEEIETALEAMGE